MSSKKSQIGDELFRLIVDSILDPIAIKDCCGNFLFANHALAKLYNTTPDAMLGKDDSAFGVPKEMSDFFRDNVVRIMEKGETEIVFEDSRDANNGETRHYKSIKIPLKNPKGDHQILIIAQDITDIMKTQKEVIKSEQRLQNVLAATQEGIWDWNILTGEVIHNHQWSDTLGYEPGELPNTLDAFLTLIYPDDHHTVIQNIQDHLEGRTEFYYSEHRMIRKNGEVFWVQDKGRVVEYDQDQKPVRVMGSFSDISNRKFYEDKLSHIAHHDVLTTLPNRVLLADRLNSGMLRTLRSHNPLAVIYLDLDGFKEINDLYGHETGDELLITLSKRMKLSLRDSDTLARIGGDEFVAVLFDLANTSACFAMLDRLLEAASKSIFIDNIELKVTASIGVTFYPQKDDVDADQLLRQADQAMYQAKLSGKNRFHVFDVDYDRNLRGKNASIEHIRNALEKNQFVLYYQPKVNMKNGQLIGAEALIRWIHPERGVIPPLDFLPYIENHPLSINIGEWVIRTALHQLREWGKTGLITKVSVNVGAYQLLSSTFVDRLRGILEEFPDVKPEQLEIEILETSTLANLHQAILVIQTCKSIGIKFALDDFGTGYSSLTYLKKLPVKVLKIDQTFVRSMLEDPDDLAILEGILGMGSAFRKEIIAEGVETTEHGEMLLLLGCELGQGYGIARPMPASELISWKERWKPEPTWLNLSQMNPHDFPLLFAGIAHRAWINALEKYVMDLSSNYPELNYEECHFGKWLNTEGKTRYSSSEIFQNLTQEHHHIHTIANEILNLFHNGRKESMPEKLQLIFHSRDRLLELLKKMQQGI